MKVLALVFLLSTVVVVLQSPAAAEPVPSSTEAILEEADLSLDMARDGQYGRINRRNMAELEEAHAVLHRLLAGHDNPEELGSEDRIALFNAQQAITALVGNDDKNRKICKRASVTGSRVGAVECMTVAEREARARASRSMVDDAQRGFCVPGETSRCGR